jgi:hypothetical protein
MVVQRYVNHGGYVMKVYRVSNSALVYPRPSLPDASEDLITTYEEYKNGFYKLSTSDLLSPEYINFWYIIKLINLIFNILGKNCQIIKK